MEWTQAEWDTRRSLWLFEVSRAGRTHTARSAVLRRRVTLASTESDAATERAATHTPRDRQLLTGGLTGPLQSSHPESRIASLPSIHDRRVTSSSMFDMGTGTSGIGTQSNESSRT